ncbi:PAS domain S-box protein [Ancylomarina euxinus]|uniref:histidine kinase n=1 Tax=Ancylomarina euxinus TaxID=2283627 RepID=A0A425Y7A3_9BACT|nr:PAS domain-containing sensor histidine kinase [Ancylomarina euxinus]MCZ4693879.1 PAS domain-containing sensor histidine kinase [Ancylomarina euxinus]MUP14701.1 PAS domain-containing protein [Ancylomarina euxinus]RRG24245.1 PAS domain S-box protein [Ancylomarina euxinus]
MEDIDKLKNRKISLERENEELNNSFPLILAKEKSDFYYLEDLKENVSIHDIISSIDDLIFILDMDGNYIEYFKSENSDLLLNPEDFLGKNYRDIMPEFIVELVDKAYEHILKGNKTYCQDYKIDVQGKIEWYNSRNTPLKNKKGEIIGIVSLCRNITNRIELQNNLKNREKLLIESNVSKNKLFSIIGHDLRGPIGSLKQLIEMMLTDCDLTDTNTIKEILQLLQKSASSTYDLVENLLAWANLQRDGILFLPTNVNLYEIIEACKLLILDLAQSKDISIHNQTSPSQFVYADRNMLMAILRNLITNAIKFSQPKTSIYLSTIDTEMGVVISVKDEGVGMNSENLDRLFKTTEYLSTFGTLGEKGTGLGLLLCKELVEKHGSKIRVKSDVGKGSVFSFFIPYNEKKMITSDLE